MDTPTSRSSARPAPGPSDGDSGLAPHRTCRVKAYDLAYVEAGSGATVLLVHGSLCDYRYWRPQLEGLSARRRVIAVSLRRYWPEAWGGSGEGFSLQTHADDLAALIEALDAGRVDLVGHSRGGTVAWLLARQHPERLRSVVLADPGLAVDDADCAGPIDIDRNNFRRRAMALIRGGDIDGGLALFTDTVSGAGTWERMVPGLKGMMRDNANTLIAQATERPLCVSAAAAQALRLPTLLVGGAHSPAPYPAILDALAALLPNARRASIPGASHAMNLWNPRAFNQAMESFLSTL